MINQNTQVTGGKTKSQELESTLGSMGADTKANG